MYNEIEIHAGHWSSVNSGANGYINEVIEVRKVGKMIESYLKQMGVPVSYYEDNVSKNQKQNINNLVKHHNQDAGALVVSIHFNAFMGMNNKPYGTEVLYYDKKDIATNVCDAIVKATNNEMKSRGVKQRKDLGVLVNTLEDAILIEVCFVDSLPDTQIYKKYTNEICRAIAETLAKKVKYEKKTHSYYLIVGSYGSELNAKKEQKRLLEKGIKTSIRKHKSIKGDTFRIIAGTYNSYTEVNNAKKTLNNKGVSSFVTKE